MVIVSFGFLIRPQVFNGLAVFLCFREGFGFEQVSDASKASDTCSNPKAQKKATNS
jgi:hypothetical protein